MTGVSPAACPKIAYACQGLPLIVNMASCIQTSWTVPKWGTLGNPPAGLAIGGLPPQRFSRAAKLIPDMARSPLRYFTR